ncbi:FtsH protease activity modulator HflK [Paenibacillus alkaliterrae]|uniref:FtsH protease activity modulator HflK n=1 Tax=Paenibacillus alkaliterrae TaxID=320909 RepID=UPI001F4623B8|nr:FtsH protease activity modulator HflK [Paenibacillus alkaliterrae]MCF2937807.1 FtsH protease activity modulator HflK [Paenibacillus alkaliterrae]
MSNDQDQNHGPNVAHVNTRRPAELKPGTVKKLVFGIAAAVIVIFVGSTSFYTVQEQERAAIMTFGKYTGESSAGLHFKWPYPIQQIHTVPAELTQRIHIGYRVNGNQETPVEDEAMMITGDENIVSADAVVQWKISNIRDFLFNIDDAEQFLRNAASSSIRSVIGSEKLDYAITDGKTVIQDKVRERLIELQAKYNTGIQIIDIKFQDIEPPSGQVAEAFREVTNAREEKNTKINNAAKYENDRIPKARGEAQALLEIAEGQKKSRILNAEGDVAKFNAIYAEYKNNPGVTQSRLVLETLEKILPNAQIFITNSNSDTVNYLPLNELLRSGSNSATAPPAATPPAATAPQGGDAQ